MNSSLSSITSRREASGSAKRTKHASSSHHTVSFTSFKDRLARSQVKNVGSVCGYNTDEPRRMSDPMAVTLPLSVGFCLKTVQEYERAVVFRSGRIKAVHGPGTYLMLPFIDKCLIVDMRTCSSQISSLEATTAESVQLVVDGVIYYRVFDPLLAVIMCNNYKETTVQLAAALIVFAFGKKSVQQVILACASNCSDLLVGLDGITLPYGVRVVSLNLRTKNDSSTLKRLSDESSRKRNSKTQTDLADAKQEIIEPSRNPEPILLQYGLKRRSTVLFTLPEDFFSADEVPSRKLSSTNLSEIAGRSSAREDDDPSFISLEQLEDVRRSQTDHSGSGERSSLRKTAVLQEGFPNEKSSERTQISSNEHLLDPLDFTTDSCHDRSSQFCEHPIGRRSSRRSSLKEPTETKQISSSDEHHPLDLSADCQALEHLPRPIRSADTITKPERSFLRKVVMPVKPQQREDYTQTDFDAKMNSTTASASKPRCPSCDSKIDLGQK